MRLLAGTMLLVAITSAAIMVASEPPVAIDSFEPQCAAERCSITPEQVQGIRNFQAAMIALARAQDREIRRLKVICPERDT